MSDTLVICAAVGGLISALGFLCAMFGGSPSAWETWIHHRTEIGKAKLEVKKTEAAHARNCPRFEDGGAQ